MLLSAFQHTVASAFTVSGVGVHSGAPARLVVRPGAADTGIVFIRTDIADRDNRIPARWNAVCDTRLCTVIANAAGARVSTVEHLMSAFAALGLDNAEVEIDGPEIPIMDGSAICFIEALDKCGLASQPRARRALVIRKAVTVRDGDKEAAFYPADSGFFSMDIAFDDPAIGRQKFRHALTPKAFRRDIARARTFGFLHEVEALRKAGLARGGSLDNAIVVDNGTILNPEGLRYPDEFVRHKLLDAVGDLYLAGAPLVGHYHGVKAGHAMNNKLLHALFAAEGAWELSALPSAAPDAVAETAVRA